MSSSLYGLFNAQRSLAVNQAAINIINNNIANMNTAGYSKQRLELSQEINVANAVGSPILAAQAGMGASIDAVSRNRDVFLDTYYRGENSSLNYYKELYDNASTVEDITNELGDNGLTGAFNDFYNAAQELSKNPTDSTARNVFVQNALNLTQRFNLVYSRLEETRENLVGNYQDASSLSTSKIKLSCDDLNNQLKAIAALNNNIAVSTAQGVTPNGLLDQRDLLLDKISEYIPINVEYGVNNQVNISLGNSLLIKGVEQVGQFNVISGIDDATPAVVQINDMEGNNVVANANSLITSGKIGAILEIGGSDPNGLNIYNYMNDLNDLAREFARTVNGLHEAGQYIDNYDEVTNTAINPPVLSSVTPTADPTLYFDIFTQDSTITQADYTTLTAGNITISNDIINDPFKVASASATAATNATGDGNNALAMAQIRNQKISGLGATETESFLNSMVGKLGIQIKSIEDNYNSQDAIVKQVDTKRESSSGVNLDEELSDLLKFQKSYEASARVFNVINEILERIISLGG